MAGAIGRRLISIPAIIVALPLLIVAAPLWIVGAAVADLLTGLRRFPTVRLGGFGVVYLIHEWIGLIVSAGLFARRAVGAEPRDRVRRLEPYRRMQAWWSDSLLRWARRILGVRIEMPEVSTLPESTFIVLSRHASMVDAVVPAVVVSNRLGRFIHYVLKAGLRWDPNLDLYGHKLGNYFVARAGDGDAEAAAIARFATEAMPDSVLVIFPEGTYSTPANQARVRASLDRRSPELAAYARELDHLLPPKPAGTLALLANQPEADIVVFGHVGLEGVAQLRGLRRRLPLTEPVVIRWWHHPRGDVPIGTAEQVAWLNDVWRSLDRWVDQVKQAAPIQGTTTGEHP